MTQFPSPGLRLPEIDLPATNGEAVSLARLPGRAVVFVYPYTGRPGVPDPPGWDDIPGAHGSTPQAHGFRDLHPEFVQSGWSVYGLSGQDTAWQQEFVARAVLPYPLLSDSGFAFADAIRLPRFAAGERIFLSRLTLLVTEGVIADVLYPVPDPAGHAAAVLQRLLETDFSRDPA